MKCDQCKSPVKTWHYVLAWTDSDDNLGKPYRFCSTKCLAKWAQKQFEEEEE